MSNLPQHPDASVTPPNAASAPNQTLSVEAVIEQARQMRQRNAEDIARRLGRGERLTAEQLYDLLHAQTLATWWLLIDRHIEHARGGRGLRSVQAVAKFVSWITPYLNKATSPDPAIAVRAVGLHSERELAEAHFDRASALMRQDAARTFLAQVETLVPASSTEQAPSTSAGQETTA